MMKRLFFVAILLLFHVSINAQKALTDSIIIPNEATCSTECIQSAIDACDLLAKSVLNNDTAAIRKAKTALEGFDISYFGSLRQQNRDERESLKGHLIFNVEFAEDLAKGKDVFVESDKYNEADLHRGQMQSGQILTKTCLVKAKGKSIYTFNSADKQELAVIAEPGGLITTRVHAVNKDKGINEWHNDTIDVSKGRSSRKTAFTLPGTPPSKVTLEITNCTNKDISVVVISN